MNTLYYGDCLTIMKERMADESVDLVYLDPPFNSKRDYNAIYKDETGRPLPDQVEAFNDTWILDAERMRTIRTIPLLLRQNDINGPGGDLLAGFLSSLAQAQPDMAAYLAYMTERLVEIRRVLKPSGGVYLHCDPTASHYLKIVMDALFGLNNFGNEVIWSYRRWPAKSKNFQRMHDVILRYHRDSNRITWNQLYEPLAASTLKADGGLKILNAFDESGRRIRGKKTGEPSPGAPMRDVWNIGILSPTAKERMGYPTQKPLALLDRIVKASSKAGDVVFDPFCGCATTIEAAENNGRKWIGIDITIHAIKRVARRLHDRLHLVQGKDYVIEGVPQNLEGAQELWRQDPYQFQKWCVEQVEGFVNVKKSADEGIDGRVYFDIPGEKVLQSLALEVKGGETVGTNTVRALRSVLQYENIQMAGLILLNEPGAQQKKNFLQTMALAGHVRIASLDYPRLQLLTVADILHGRRFNMPRPVGRSESGYDTDLFSHGGGV